MLSYRKRMLRTLKRSCRPISFVSFRPDDALGAALTKRWESHLLCQMHIIKMEVTVVLALLALGGKSG